MERRRGTQRKNSILILSFIHGVALEQGHRYIPKGFYGVQDFTWLVGWSVGQVGGDDDGSY